MLVTSQLLIQSENIFCSCFDMHLWPHTLKKVPLPMGETLLIYVLLRKMGVENRFYFCLSLFFNL